MALPRYECRRSCAALTLPFPARMPKAFRLIRWRGGCVCNPTCQGMDYQRRGPRPPGLLGPFAIDGTDGGYLSTARRTVLSISPAGSR